MKNCIVIPARFKSTRFPGKPLVKILGKEMIIHVAEACAKAIHKKDIYILTDNEEIKNIVEKNNFNCLLTSNDAKTGTDRITEIIDKLDYDNYINVQGDEPLVNPKDILKCIELKIKNPSLVINGFTQIDNWEDFYSKNIPKVITDRKNNLIYMSRSPIPGSKNIDSKISNLKRQVCIYGFSKVDLEFIRDNQNKNFLEEKEDIEILRFIEHGRKVLMYECSSSSIAVDIPDDVQKVISVLNNQK